MKVKLQRGEGEGRERTSQVLSAEFIERLTYIQTYRLVQTCVAIAHKFTADAQYYQSGCLG